MSMIDNLEKDVIDAKTKKYIQEYGDDALKIAVTHTMKANSFHGKNDFIEIMYYEKGEVRHILIVGDVLQHGDYIINQINKSSDIYIIKRLNDKYYPLEVIKEGDFI